MSPEEIESLAAKRVAVFQKTVLDNPWIPEKPFNRQAVFLLHYDINEILFGGAAGGGKMLRVDEPIPTPTGWAVMGELQVGDAVFTEKGEVCHVTAAHPVDLNPEAYRLTFDDGAAMEACAGHLWLTYNAKELSQLTRLDPEWRAQRQAKRPSRSNGRKSAYFTAPISRRNSLLAKPKVQPPTGAIRTTAEIAATLRTPKGRANHAVPVGSALSLPDVDLPLDSYALGCWLGDGMSANSGFASADEEVVNLIRAVGWPVKRRPCEAPYAWVIGENKTTPGVRGVANTFVSVLRQLGVLNNKHVPAAYLRASGRQRMALLQGLLDTDGTVSDGGAASFSNTNRRLVDAVRELIVSLGWKASITEKRAVCNGKDCGPVWTVKWMASEYVFQLSRKRDKQKLASRRTTRFRYIVGCERCPSSPMRCIAVDNPTGLYLAGRSMVPTHNSKALLAAAAQYVSVPSYRAILFRNTEGDLKQAGGLIERSHEWWGRTKAKYNGEDFYWTFPSGAKIRFDYMQHDEHALKHRGAEYQFIGWDELTLHQEFHYTFLFRSLRKLTVGPIADVPLRVRATSNPGGKGMAFVRDRFVPNEYMEEPDEESRFGRVWWKRGDDDVDRLFVPSRAKDNPCLDYESYVASLMQLDPVARAQQLHGDWRDFSGGRFFKEWFARRWFRHGDYYYVDGDARPNPKGWHKSQVRVFMAVDPAGTKRKRSDYTAAAVFGACPDGDLLVLHVLHQKFFVHEMLPAVAGIGKEWQCQTVGMESDTMHQLIVEAARKTAGMPPVTPLFTRNQGKLHRAIPAIRLGEQGKIVLPEQRRPWESVFLTNVLAFTGDPAKDQHDDVIDVLGYGVYMMKSVGPRWPEADDKDGKVPVPESRRLEDRRFETRQHIDRNHYGRGR